MPEKQPPPTWMAQRDYRKLSGLTTEQLRYRRNNWWTYGVHFKRVGEREYQYNPAEIDAFDYYQK